MGITQHPEMELAALVLKTLVIAVRSQPESPQSHNQMNAALVEDTPRKCPPQWLRAGLRQGAHGGGQATASRRPDRLQLWTGQGHHWVHQGLYQGLEGAGGAAAAK